MNERFNNNLQKGFTTSPKEIIKEFNIMCHTHVVTQNKKTYINFPICFDIETTNVIKKIPHGVNRRGVEKFEEQKGAFMYAFTLCVNGISYIGRTWFDFHNVLQMLRSMTKSYITIFVQNLDFEFQFIKDRFEWEEVKTTGNRKPFKAITTDGVIFRCSAKMSNASLSTIGKNLNTYKIMKMVGDLDYNIPRNSKTVLTFPEYGYIENDGKVVCAYIQEYLDMGYKIPNIPNTSTGFVREFVRKKMKEAKDKRVQNWKLTLEEYQICKWAFQGGYTHANAKHVGNVIPNVKSFDFASSYPAVMLSEKYPIGNPIHEQIYTLERFEFINENYLSVFHIKLHNVRQRESVPDSYISYSKCETIVNPVLNNGRVVECSELSTCITNIDYEIIRHCYTFDEYNIEICDFMYWEMDYLPSYMIDSVIELFHAKSTLKGISGSETEYMMKKAMLNSLYGMCVTDSIKPQYTYMNGDWQMLDISNIDEYNNDKQRFTYYPWGVFITAYARRNLWNGIFELGDDYVYSDTDSVKFINYEKHSEYFAEYNKNITNKIYTVLRFFGYIDYKLPKPLGIWDDDGHYKQFKTLGAKRYCILTDDDNFKITIAGLSKTASEYIKNRGGFDFFIDGMTIPHDYINYSEYVTVGTAKAKLAHTYIDTPLTMEIIDKNGVAEEMTELSCCNLSSVDFTMSLATDYLRYLQIFINYAPILSRK